MPELDFPSLIRPLHDLGLGWRKGIPSRDGPAPASLLPVPESVRPKPGIGAVDVPDCSHRLVVPGRFRESVPGLLDITVGGEQFGGVLQRLSAFDQLAT